MSRLGACLAAWITCAEAQIKVVAPAWLKSKFDRGFIEGSTATFGAPFYGDDVVGRLVYGEHNGKMHCTDDDYDVPSEETEERGNYKAVKLINIVVVRRGKCSFTTKVKVAYNKGAHAVIFVDKEDSPMTAADLKNVIVGDDGFGESIHIPSILISKQEGNKLIDAIKSSTQVIAELSWDIPLDHIVGLDLWMSSGSTESMEFLKKFAPARKALNEVMHFTPHYAVFSMPSSDPSVYQDLCSDTTGEYCAEDPDAAGDITGKDVLEEDVRQLCIHELTKVPKAVREEHALAAAEAAEEAERKHAEDINSGKTGKSIDEYFEKPTRPVIMYAEPYWTYVSKVSERCPIDGKTSESRFGFSCSQKLMEEVGIDTYKVNKCVLESKDKKLKNERDHGAWSPRALRINGWRYTGMLDPDLVTRAVCAGFATKPIECEELVKGRDVFGVYRGSTITEGGVGEGGFVTGLLAIAIFVGGAMLCYKSVMKSQLQNQVREEVMLEVQSAMATYNRMHGHD